MNNKRVIKFLFSAGRFCSYFITPNLIRLIKNSYNKFYSGWLSRQFLHMPASSTLVRPIYIIGQKHISIGFRTTIGTSTTLSAWYKCGELSYNPSIKIGNDVSIGAENHITAINRIEIGNNVLTGKKVTITDNSHGICNFIDMNIPPVKRPWHSSGPVIIEDNVWIGDKATILPNVTIGHNSIIGANAVVSKDVLPFTVVGGIPAKTIKRIDINEK